jgi:hypothetical protein
MAIYINLFEKVTELLQYFTGSIVITTAAGPVTTLTSSGIGAGFSVNDIIQLTGTAGTTNDLECRIVSIAAGDGSMVVAPTSGAFGADETASTGKINQVLYTGWQDVCDSWEVGATIHASGALDATIQQSWEGVLVDINGTKVDVAGSTPTIVDEETKCRFARLKLLNQDNEITSMRAYFGGKVG